MDENLPEKIKKTYGYEEASIIADIPIPNNSNRIVLANVKDSEGYMDSHVFYYFFLIYLHFCKRKIMFY